jgi:hypothetical protein
MLNDYESAAVRSWALDHARRCHPTARSTEEVIDEARKIEQYLTGRSSASVSIIRSGNGKRK